MHISRLFATLAAFAAVSAHADASFTAPTPYLQASDNPLAGTYDYSHLENFEDGLADTSGLSVSGGRPSGISEFADSVDGDDGLVDGSSAQGQSWYSYGQNFLTFSFSAAALGALPTQVGLAFTDIGNRFDGAIGYDTASLEVFDRHGASAGLTRFAFGDGSAFSSTDEDRFVGATFAGGISMMRVGFVQSGDWEVDHVFYAGAVPEPGTWALMAAGLGLLVCTARRHRR